MSYTGYFKIVQFKNVYCAVGTTDGDKGTSSAR